jgi:hypothetical protein
MLEAAGFRISLEIPYGRIYEPYALQTGRFGEPVRTVANARQRFAMQKVVGSSPIIRSKRACKTAGTVG